MDVGGTNVYPGTNVYMGNLVNGVALFGPQLEVGGSASSYIPTTTAAVTRAADVYSETETPYPAQLDLLGGAVTRGHIGLPLAVGETAGMARLSAEGGGLREWGGELVFVS